MSDTIRRWKCPKCGKGGTFVGASRYTGHIADGDSSFCPGIPVERVYVAVDALLSDEAMEGYTRGHDIAVAERNDFPDPLPGWSDEWINDAREGIRAAINAMTGAQP